MKKIAMLLILSVLFTSCIISAAPAPTTNHNSYDRAIQRSHEGFNELDRK